MRLWLMILLLPCMALPTRCWADDDQKLDKAFIASQSDVLRAWLEETELSELLQLIRVRRSRHPLESVTHKIYRLELRMVTQDSTHDSTQEQNLAYLHEFDRIFQEVNQVTLFEKLFYKHLHLFDLSPSDASVHVHVQDTDLATYLAEDGSLVTEASNSRDVGKSILIEEVELRKQPRVLVSPKSLDVELAIEITPAKLRWFFKSYYMREPAAKIRFNAVEKDFIGFSVREIRDEIVDEKYWEKIQVSLVFYQLPERGWKFRCFLDAQFAPGLGNRPPPDESYRDMEPRYAKQLNDYVGQLMVALRDHLTKGKTNEGSPAKE